MVNEVDSNAKFSAKKIKVAIQALETSLGRAAVDSMMSDLEIYGLPLVNEHELYSLEQIRTAIQKIFGEEATPLLFERVKIALLKKTKQN